MTAPASGPPGPPALELTGLRKTFGSEPAVDGVDLTVPAGSFTGVVGPNGAGKTTTLSMAVGLLRPDAGSARIGGVDVWADPAAAKAVVGVLPADLSLPERLTGPEVLTYLGLLRGLDRTTVTERSAELLAVLELDGDGRTLVGEYSTGMAKKIGLAAALLHGPRLLVLDEPFESVDPVSAATIRTILRRFVGGGRTVVLSSHAMGLVEDVCDRVAVIAGGRVRAEGTLAEVRGEGSLEDRFVELVGARAGGGEGLAWLAS
jgi:ABC-2 type transport system ATP-binding protein